MQCRACIAADTGFTPLRRLMQDECRNYMTKWLCGTHDDCMDASSPAALSRALQRLHSDFDVVGVTEHMEDTLTLLATRLPKFFPAVPLPPTSQRNRRVRRGLRDTTVPNATLRSPRMLGRAWAAAQGDDLTARVNERHYPQPSAFAAQLLLAWNANDVALYVTGATLPCGAMRVVSPSRASDACQGTRSLFLCRYEEAERLLHKRVSRCVDTPEWLPHSPDACTAGPAGSSS